MANERNQIKQDSDAARRKKEEQARKSRRRSRQLIGVALSILIIIGAVSIVNLVIDATKNLLDNSAEKEQYEELIKPFVWFDALPFSSVDQVDQNALKQIVIWSILQREGDKIQRNENELAIIPVVEVNKYASELFGPDFQFLEHAAFSDATQGLNYQFETADDGSSSYIAPGTGLEPAYTATVVDIKNESNGIKRVIVGYVSLRNTQGGIENKPDYEHPVQYRDYLFQRNGSNYYLYAMQPNTTVVPTPPSEDVDSQTQSVYVPSDDSEPDSYIIAPSSPPSSAAENSSSEESSSESSGTGSNSSSSSSTSSSGGSSSSKPASSSAAA